MRGATRSSCLLMLLVFGFSVESVASVKLRGKVTTVHYTNKDIGKYSETIQFLTSKVVTRQNHFSTTVEDFNKGLSAVMYRTAPHTCIVHPTLTSLKREVQVVLTGHDRGPHPSVNLQAEDYSHKSRWSKSRLGQPILRFCSGKNLILTRLRGQHEARSGVPPSPDTPGLAHILFLQRLVLSGSASASVTLTSAIDISINAMAPTASSVTMETITISSSSSTVPINDINYETSTITMKTTTSDPMSDKTYDVSTSSKSSITSDLLDDKKMKHQRDHKNQQN